MFLRALKYDESMFQMERRKDNSALYIQLRGVATQSGGCWYGACLQQEDYRVEEVEANHVPKCG